MGNGREEEGREGAMACGRAVGACEGSMPPVAATLDELETTAVASATAERD
jgi:hypothetical protein